MTPLISYGTPPGIYVVFVTVDLENTSSFGGIVKCELVNQHLAGFGRGRQYVGPFVGNSTGGGSIAFHSVQFIHTGTTLTLRCGSDTDGPTLPTVYASARLLFIPAQNFQS